MVDLPTPPLALETRIVCFVPFIGVLINCFGGAFGSCLTLLNDLDIISLLLNLFLEKKSLYKVS